MVSNNLTVLYILALPQIIKNIIVFQTFYTSCNAKQCFLSPHKLIFIISGPREIRQGITVDQRLRFELYNCCSTNAQVHCTLTRSLAAWTKQAKAHSCTLLLLYACTNHASLALLTHLGLQSPNLRDQSIFIRRYDN